MIAGSYAALGIVAALKEREGSGLGQAVDVSMVDCLFSMMMDEPLDAYEKLGLAARQGNRIMRISPQALRSRSVAASPSSRTSRAKSPTVHM